MNLCNSARRHYSPHKKFDHSTSPQSQKSKLSRQIDRELQELVIEFDGKRVEYQFGELDEVALAYAVSIHKSQESEYPAVVIPIMMQHYMMLQRNLLYTGITTGKKMVILVGQRKGKRGYNQTRFPA